MTPTNSFLYSGVARLTSGAVAISIYTTILTNVQSSHAAMLVPAAPITACLPTSSAKALLTALSLGSAALAKMPGITAKIAVAGGKAFQQSYVFELRTTVLSLLSFGIIGIIGELKILYFFSLLPCVRSWLENEIFQGKTLLTTLF